MVPAILYSLLFGYLLWFVFFEYPPHRHELDFEGSAWITTGGQTPNGYFVKELYATDDNADAWVAIAATDRVDLYVNNKKISTDTFISANVSNIYDLTGKIKKGKNVISAYVSRSSYPGVPRFLLKGAFMDRAGKQHVFATDGSWKTSVVEERQVQGTVPWYSEKFDHSRWGNAAVEGNASLHPILQPTADPFLFTHPLSAFWIWAPESDAKSVFFTKSVTLQSPIMDGVIGIAGIPIYELTVNGLSIAKNPGSNNNLNIYDITPLLQKGENIIGIGVKVTDMPPGFLAEGYIRDRDATTAFRSDATWKVTAYSGRASDIRNMHSLPWKVPVLLAPYRAEPWNVLGKNAKDINIPLSFSVKKAFGFGLFLAGTAAVLLGFWLLAGLLYSSLGKGDFIDALRADGLLHLPPFLFLCFIYLLKFDIRYSLSFPFQKTFLLVSLIILIALRLIQFVGLMLVPSGAEKRSDRKEIFGNRIIIVLLASLMVTGLFVRIRGLDIASLSHDEITILQFTEGLLTKGTPSKIIGPYLRPMTTYELLPYSVGFSSLLFGFNDYGARMHSVFWGTLEILLIYLLGKTLFNRKTGLLAAAIFAFHPWCVTWSQNLFYPQMTQALTTITMLLFYKALDSDFTHKKYMYFTGLAFALMYLSWEGSGFILLGMFAALLVCRGADLSWLKNKHVWGSFAIIFITVFIQQSRRLLAQTPYLLIGSKISDIGLPTLFFLDPMYDPYFYINTFFLMENNFILTLGLIAGIPLIFKNKALRYLYVVLVSVAFSLTNFLSIHSSRYVYNLEPFLILISSSVGFIYFDSLRGYIRTRNIGVTITAYISSTAFALILFVASNNIFFSFYLLAKEPEIPPTLARANVYWYDYRSVNKYVADNARRGDLILVMMPHTLEYYTKLSGNLSFSTLMARTFWYAGGKDQPTRFIDKFLGNPAITNFHELENVAAQYNRIWFISAPQRLLDVANDEQTTAYITKNFKVVYESYDARVYLWEK